MKRQFIIKNLSKMSRVSQNKASSTLFRVKLVFLMNADLLFYYIENRIEISKAWSTKQCLTTIKYEKPFKHQNLSF